MYDIVVNLNPLLIAIITIGAIYIQAKAADTIVDDAIKISKMLELPEAIIGATIVSLGTSIPDLSSSIVSTIKRQSAIAVGSSIGSIITNTTLILGIAALFGKIPLSKNLSKMLNILIITTSLLILPTISSTIGNAPGLIPRWLGFLFIILLPLYVYYLIRKEKVENPEPKKNRYTRASIAMVFIRIFTIAIGIAFTTALLISSLQVIAKLIDIPTVQMSTTLVAFGISIPELSIAIAATRKKHGGLAIGNILGANILNIIFVIGSCVAISPGDIKLPKTFYSIHFLSLAIVLLIFSSFIYSEKINELTEKEGLLLILVYIAYLITNILVEP